MKQWEEIRMTIEKIAILGRTLSTGVGLALEEKQGIADAVALINTSIYGFGKIKFQDNYNFEDGIDEIALGRMILELVPIWYDSLDRRCLNKVDMEFNKLYDKFRYVSVDDIYNDAVAKFMALSDEQKEYYYTLRKRYTFLTEGINYREGDFGLIKQHADMMVENVENYKWLYEKLGDYRSKEVLNGIISYWFDYDIEKMHRHGEFLFPDYFDFDLVKCDENEVMVDCGAYIGDSAFNFISSFQKYKRIYAFEMSAGAFTKMTENLSGYDNIVCIQKAVGKESCTLYVDDEQGSEGNSISSSGTTAVELVSLDEEITEPVSLIKMDVEGAEKDAIEGAKNHIINDKPKLLISAYHIPADIFDIPALINEIRDDYKYYLRLNGRGIWPCDYVLFAL